MKDAKKVPHHNQNIILESYGIKYCFFLISLLSTSMEIMEGTHISILELNFQLG